MTWQRRARFGVLLFAAASCGHYRERPGHAPELSETKIELPPGALCRPADAAEPVTPACAADGGAPNGPIWSDEQPPGLCYTLDGPPCEGLEDHVAYLTFDDGPSDWTAAVLDTLASRGVHATFFVNARGLKSTKGLHGSYADASGRQVPYGELILRILAEGHALGNHTTDHLDLGTLSEADIRKQLQENERLVNRALLEQGAQSEPLSLLRPPFGSPWQHGKTPLPDPEASRLLTGRTFMRFGYNVLWNITSTDADEWAIGESYNQVQLSKMQWESALPYADKVQRIRSTTLDHPLVAAGKGILVLMHDSHNATRDALPDIIDGLRERGYAFETVEQQVYRQYGRASLELTPGPALTQACSQERQRSCSGLTGPSGATVCGRFWEAFTAFGAEAALGLPLSAPERSEHGALAQRFERGWVELHPELDPPCDAVLLPE